MNDQVSARATACLADASPSKLAKVVRVLSQLKMRLGRSTRLLFSLLIVVCLITMFTALCVGPIALPVERVAQVLFLSPWQTENFSLQERVIIFDLRLTRVVLAMSVGAGLALTGAVFQGLFRNPLADPGLIGVSSGAACGAVFIIVLGTELIPWYMGLTQSFAVPIGAFLGSLVVTFIVYKIGSLQGTTSTASLLLAGIAISAICQALFGILTYVADDNQLRTLTFWTLGSLAGASWQQLFIVIPIIVTASGVLISFSKALDTLLMGEAVSFHLGLPVEKVKKSIIVFTALIVGCAVSISGIIAFVGLVVPHLVRMILGPNHQRLLPASAIVGGILLLIADTISRTLVSPAEIPIGLVTSLIGGPFFIWLLIHNKHTRGL